MGEREQATGAGHARGSRAWGLGQLLMGLMLVRVASRLRGARPGWSRGLAHAGVASMRRGLHARALSGTALTPDGEASFVTDDGLRLRYYRWGAAAPGPVVVLHHGFAANAHANWVGTGVVRALLQAGRQVLALDARGHGQSDKPHDPACYGEACMARDLLALTRHLDIASFDLVGYSMGAIVSLLVATQGAPIRRLIIGGVGEGVLECGGVDVRQAPPEGIARALLEPDAADIAHAGALLFRLFAERLRADTRALAAQAQAFHHAPIALHRIAAPTLVIAGTRDVLARHPQRLAQAIAGARCLRVPGDHLGAVARREFVDALTGFLDD